MAKDTDTKKSWFRRHKFLTIVLALLAIIIIGSALGGSKSDTSSTANGSKAASDNAKKAAATAKLNEKVRDGKFEFVVTGIKCGETTIGNEYLNAKAQGQFCRLQLSVTNIGNEAQSLFADNQKLLDAQGREYSYSSSATIYAEPSSSTTWYNQINPGNTVTGDIVFDVPASTVPATAELHDSSFSGGVKVTLE